MTVTRTNYCLNPGFEATFVAGMSPNWQLSGSKVGTPVTTQSSAIFGSRGSKSQRVQYTGVAGDAGKTLKIYTFTNAIPVGSPAGCSFLIVGACTGVTVKANLTVDDSGWGYKTDASSAALTLTGTPQLAVAGVASLPSGSVYVVPAIVVSGIDEGDVIDFTIDDCMLDVLATPGVYFDGSYPFCKWLSTANASRSTYDAGPGVGRMMLGMV